MGCNRKVKLLVYSFGVGESFKKVTLASDPASQNANKAAKWIYSSKKRKLSDFGRIISLPNI